MSDPTAAPVVVPETYIWLVLGLVLLVTHGHEMAAWSAVALFCRKSFFWDDFLTEQSSSRQRTKALHSSKKKEIQLWRGSSSNTSDPKYDQGLAILILTSLWTLVRPVGYTSNAWIIPWILASRDTILASITTSTTSSNLSTYVIGVLGVLGLWCHTAWQWYAPGKMLVAHFLSDTIHYISALQQVFTIDEWQTFSFLAAGVWLQWMEEIVTQRQAGLYYFYNIQDHPDAYLTAVGCAGNIGVVWATSWVTSQRQSWPLILQLLVLVVLPLILVDVSLYLITDIEPGEILGEDDWSWIPQQWLPRSIQWLLSFLVQSEEPLWDSIPPIGVPRLGWLVYWALVMSIGIFTAPSGPALSHVMTRKWFHGVAVLLFTPVTLYAPRLQSMGYAIAVAVLIGLEGVRPRWPLLQQFYTRYLDPTKDGRAEGKGHNTKSSRDVVIISHTALCMGCAMPLWCYQMAGDRLSPVVPFLGILVVGVGDACGAVVGKYLGENKWSAWMRNLPKSNHRTIEGSLAMWVSQILFVGLLDTCGVPVQWFLIGPPLFFATLLEGLTSQMDNLMLPLAVTAFYGLWEEALS